MQSFTSADTKGDALDKLNDNFTETSEGLAAALLRANHTGVQAIATISELQAALDSKAATSHNHAASDITSGTIATARLGSGSATGSTYLRGDGTWASLSGGAGTWGAITGTLSDQADLQAVLTAIQGDITALEEDAADAVNIADPGVDSLFGWDEGTNLPVAYTPAECRTLLGLGPLATAEAGTDYIAVTGTAASGKVPIASSATEAAWGNLPGAPTMTEADFLAGVSTEAMSITPALLSYLFETYASGTPTVATPVFDPVAGEYPDTEEITITCATSGASIYYTTDGSTPDTGDALYTAPIAITAATYKAKAFKTDYTDSAVATAAYTIEESGGGGGSFAFVASDITPSGANGENPTDAIDTTGAKLLVACVHHASIGSISGVSDSKGNTWIPLTTRTDGSAHQVKLYYCINGTVGTGHTFSATGTDIFSTLSLMAFSDAATPAFHSESGIGAGTQPGSLTPTVDGALVIVACTDSLATNSPTGGFTILRSANGGTMGATIGYMIQGTAAAINPTFDSSAAIAMAVFEP